VAVAAHVEAVEDAAGEEANGERLNFQHNRTVKYVALSYLYLIQATVAHAFSQPLGLDTRDDQYRFSVDPNGPPSSTGGSDAATDPGTMLGFHK